MNPDPMMEKSGPRASVETGRLTFGQAIVRGVTLRCPACGRGKLFRNMFQMHRACVECGFRYERAPGYFLGSTYINYGVTALTTTVSYVLLRFGAGIAKEQLLPGLMVFCLIFPLVFFRFARSLWLSIDCCLDQIGASESTTEI
jgi:uncharacterized protein (DUF983 family)